MKTELRMRPHAVTAGAPVIELWHDGVFVGTVVGADGPGVRVITRHPIAVVRDDSFPAAGVVEIRIGHGGSNFIGELEVLRTPKA